MEAGRPPTGGDERLTDDERRLERISLSLRTTNGVAVDQVDLSLAAPYLQAGLLVRSNGHVVLTERGMLLANEVALALA